MQFKELKPWQALNKAFLKTKPVRSEIARFKANLALLLERANDHESEEFHKNLVSDFLKKTYYDPGYFINTKGHNDLVVHIGPNAGSPVGVIIEAKKPTNKAEMISPKKWNTKAFQELVLYYLRERILHKNLEVKHLVVTNIFEWYIFDAVHFDRVFAQNKNLVKQFSEFAAGRLAGTKTDFFYKNIAGPFIEDLSAEIEYVCFNLKDFHKSLYKNTETEHTALIALFKFLSPEHLLKLPFANDSNSLNKGFYNELLYILGLTETKTGGKRLIERNKPGERHTGTLLEDTILHLDSLDKLSRIQNPGHFGNTDEERLFGVALELCITWINRILFLKLLEAQLVACHKGDTSFAFLNPQRIKSYDDLNSLFFQVLARKMDERNEEVKADFSKVPYLNSSLFEPTDIEQVTLFISNLKDGKLVPVFSQTVLKDQQGKRRTGSMPALEYLFDFLNAYDFGSDGAEEIREDSKTLINASVLGLIFEKINGYKDGSFFTPGFITMYMCRETIRKSVLRKFSEVKQLNCDSIEVLRDKIENIQEANDLINSIRICDPAVGSGHFLVSALNEIIAVKNDLGILCDFEGRPLRNLWVEVVQDELFITDKETGEEFNYIAPSPRSEKVIKHVLEGGTLQMKASQLPPGQVVQQSLFLEKQKIIENCLFGVDINPNSVKICRLRLWIELLKNAYYTPESNFTALETLPNIDINIKCGNSLVSRFALDTDLRQALKKSRWNIEAYRLAVATYRNATTKDQKREMERLILEIKQNFSFEIRMNDPLKKRLDKLASELYHRFTGTFLFEPEKPYGNKSEEELKSQRKAEQEKLEKEIEELSSKIEEIKSNRIFENAFEWRFEFPEVLDDDGHFVGFDVVIGNPPYIRQEELAGLKPYFNHRFSTFFGTADLYVYFVELGMDLLRKDGSFAYILPNKWMRAGYGKNLRQYLRKLAIKRIVDFGDLPVFDEATTYPCIIQMEKADAVDTFEGVNVRTLDFGLGKLISYVRKHAFVVKMGSLQEEGWILADETKLALLDKIRGSRKPLGEYLDGKLYRGVLTGLNEAFVIDRPTRDHLVSADPKSAEVIKPFLAGRDLKRYQTPTAFKYLLFTRRGIDIDRYPAIKTYLEQFKDRLEPKPKDWPGYKEWLGRKEGSYKWYEIQDSIDYYPEFEKPKILYQEIAAHSTFTLDYSGLYANNKLFFIPDGSPALLALLNSKLVWFWLKANANILRGALALQSPYMMAIPVAEGVLGDDILTALAEETLRVKGSSTPDTSALESEIDQRIYQFYHLTEEEITFIEQNQE
jgi:hypothetical protein